MLPCKVKDKIGDCQWTKDGFGLGVKTWLPGFPRYSMSEQGGGSCDLIIEPVLPADEASYTCQVGVGKAYQQKPIVSRAAKVRVTSEPGKPYIKQATDYDVKVEMSKKLKLDSFMFSVHEILVLRSCILTNRRFW